MFLGVRAVPWVVALIVSTVVWFGADWVGGLIWPDNDTNVFFFSWICAIVIGAAVRLAFIARRSRSTRRNGRWN